MTNRTDDHDLLDFPDAAELKAARCRYCGGYPCSGGTDIFSITSGSMTESLWMCMSCAIEYHEHVQKALSGLTGTHLTAVKQMELMKDVRKDVDQHMRQFVSVRDN